MEETDDQDLIRTQDWSGQNLDTTGSRWNFYHVGNTVYVNEIYCFLSC